MTEQAPDRVWSGIDVTKTIAGALAAVCAAVIGSYLGVAGTLVGAAVASIIGSIGTEIWTRSIKRGGETLHKTVAPAFVKAPAAVGTPEVAAATEEELPSHTVPETPKRQIRWKRVWLVAGALFVLAMGSLTVFELISGKSVASTVGNNTGATSTWGGLLNPGSSTKTTPATTTTPTATVTPTGGDDTTSTEAPATTSPTSPAGVSNTSGGGQTTTEPTQPATEAPAQTPPPGGQNLNEDQGQGGGQSTP